MLVLLLGILGGATAFGYVSALVKSDPVRSMDTIKKQMQENAETGFAYFNDDSVIGQLRTEEDRRLIGLKDIPQVVLDAVLAIEDNDFYDHNGVDLRGLVRAVSQKVMNEDVQTGGSTITQQLARRVFLTLDRDDGRKAREILLALRLDRLMSKDEILLAYLNKIPYGSGSTGYNLYGIKAAAKGLFNINDLNEINIAQAAYLAGIPQQPSNYSAFTSTPKFDDEAFQKALVRQRLVLKRMLEEQKITEAQYQEALNFDLKASMPQPSQKAYNTYPFLMIETERQAAEILLKQQHPEADPKKNPTLYNEALKAVQNQLLRGGYQVYTTIDKTIYDSMRGIAEDKNNFAPKDPVKGTEQVGAIMLDSKTGAILGMIEGRDFFEEQLNHATQAYRQPGSTMKPIAAYIPALDSGAIQPASVIDDVPIILKDGGKGYHIPENWDNKFHGLITARRALDQSYNIPAIKLFTETVGIDKAWEFAKKLGINSIQDEDYQAQTGVIGGLKYGVSVKELTHAFAAIPNQGKYNESFMIRKITDANGKIIYEHEVKPTSVFSEQTSYLITDMMKTVIKQGTATDLKKKFKSYGKIEISGKTGSTQEDADAWFVGFSPDITVGVWIGYDQPIHKLSSKLKQTNHAKDIWASVMNMAIEKKPELFPNDKFTKPEGIVSATVSNLSGKLPSAVTKSSGHLVTDIFNSKFVPKEVDDVMVNMPIITYNGLNYIAHPETPEEFVTQKLLIKRQKSIAQLLKELGEIMKKVPAKNRKSLDRYKPLDYQDDAPSETDPRVDDGKAPNSPTTVIATKSGSQAVITFQPSTSTDVVGYRLYKSEGLGSFKRVDGNIIAGQESKFVVQTSASTIDGYYVTAVDVGGKESPPSKQAFTDGSFGEDDIPPGEDQTSPGKPDPNQGNGTENGSGNGTNNNNNGNGNGSESGGNQGTEGQGSASKPSSPAGLKAKEDGAGVMFTWSANPGKENVKQYILYYSEKEGGTYNKLGSVKNATEFYYYAITYKGFYRLTAISDSGESSPSQVYEFKG
ncbi:transglycosylase domain-containing protein [Paenibacillus eucommiae]|uniref:Penicillin-binding protein n=1 Tax=Paenibacillus eucommiae TaxID=1355755 RepID=A0ABS4J9G5_9BACL|nr:transglycosylase domain-containing protein [Paenibacillus eucommiae]MBP1996486.1 penicillin-binding protein [Paenibacillus eucommiae]